MKKIYKISFLLVFSLTGIFCGCKKTNLSENSSNLISSNTISVEITKTNHIWYYFTNLTFRAIDKVQNVPAQQILPWTEAIRISSANNTADAFESTTAYAVVNRLGMLKFENDGVFLSPDVTVFNGRTAGNLVFVNNIPVYSVYKSSFFNNTISDPSYKNNSAAHLFLLQFDPYTKISYPIINSTSIIRQVNSEITDFHWDGLEWICSIKTISDNKNDFSYVKFRTQIPLLAISPSTANSSLSIEESSLQEFRNCKTYINYSQSPERIKKLLSGFDKKLPFIIEVKTAGGTSPRTYENLIAGSQEKNLNAKAILSQSWSAALFEDGTLYLEGALPGHHILRSGMPVAIRLPKLPVGFVYSDFVISGTTLYAAWEESSFYKTGRSGFLQVNLDRTLYSRLI